MLHRFRPLLCPECNYDQRGLGAFHTCPECGFQFDPNLSIYRAVPERIHFVPLILGLSLVLVGGILPALFGSLGGVPRIRTWQWINIIAGGLIALGAWDGILGFRWRFAIIGLDELRLARGAERLHVPWSDVRSITLWPTMVVTIRVRSPRRTMHVRGVFESWAHARQFANLARQRVFECRAEETPVSPSPKR